MNVHHCWFPRTLSNMCACGLSVAPFFIFFHIVRKDCRFSKNQKKERLQGCSCTCLGIAGLLQKFWTFCHSSPTGRVASMFGSFFFPMCLSRMRSLLHLKPLKVVNCRRVARIPRHFSGFPRCTSFAQRLAFLLTRIGSWPGGMDVGSAQANSWNHVLPCCSLSGREHFLSPSHVWSTFHFIFF